MGKFSDIDIDEMLKRIQDNVDKQTSSPGNEEKNASPEAGNTPDELINKLKAHMGENGTAESDSASEADDYDISGFEIEESDGDEETAIAPFEGDEIESEKYDGEKIEKNVAAEETNDEASDEKITEDESESPFEDYEEADVEPLKNVPADLYDELSVKNGEDGDEDEFDGVLTDNDEEVRKRVEQYVNDTVEPLENFIFFDSLDKRAKHIDETEIAVKSATDAVEDKAEEKDDMAEDDTLEAVTESFKKAGEDDDFDIQPEAVVNEHNELDDADINFAISLGSKDSLESAMGFVKVRAAKHNFVDPAEKDAIGNIILDYKKEYKNYGQNEEIKDSYRKEKKKIGKRLLFTSLALLVILFCEIIFSAKSVNIPYVSEFLATPLHYYLISIALLAIAVAFSAKKLFIGIVGYLTEHNRYYTAVSFVTAVNILYNLLVLTVFKNEEMIMLNSVCVFALVMSIIGEYMQVSREIRTFNLVSDDRPKISLERVDRSKEMIERESYLKCNDFFIENTNFVGKYFERSARSPESYRVTYTYMTLTMLLSLLVSVVAVIMTRNFSDFVLAFELSALLCVPVQFVLLGTYQFYVISKKLYKLDSAIIGETVSDEYVGTNTIYLDDIEVFGKHGVHVVNLEPFNSFNIIDVNYYYLSVFSQIDGPLKNAFGEIPERMKISENVKLLNVYQGGIEALVDGKNRILVGNADFLASRGVRLGGAGEEKHYEKEKTCVMFMSVNNALCAKLHLKYTITHRFEAFAEDMAENHAHVGVRTIDPNITEEMIAELRGDKTDVIKVMRPTLNDLVPIGRRSDSGVITAKNPHMIAKILAEGLKVKKINTVIKVLWAIYSFIGIGSVIVFSIFGIFDNILPFYIIGYQVLWTAGVAIYIRNKLRNRKSR